mmetsp:Transcript_5524/g.13304  ORF Transcript_5524/g.13304 Transcript_5524/m.13304 type:complete len:206 (+) Transcript_5524:862-1479(+)
MAEMVLVDSHTVQDFSIDLFIFDIDQVHLFTDTLHGGLRTQRGDVRTDETMRLTCNRFRFDVLVEFHVTGVDTEHLQTSILVGDTDIDFTVEPSEPTKGWVDSVGTVRCTDDDDRRTLFQPVHKSKHLTDDTTFNFTVRLFTFGCDGINLINEDDGGCVLFCLLECFAEVTFRLAGHFRHNFGTVDQEEECTRLVGNGTCDKSLS